MVSSYSIRRSEGLQNTINSLNSHTISSQREMQRLTSGKRINGARDDGAGVCISSHLNAQLRSTNQAKRNMNDAASLLQVADSGLNKIQELLHKVRDLAVQAANGGALSAQERAFLDQEKAHLLDEISNVAKTTELNGFFPISANSNEYHDGGGGGGSNVPTLLQQFVSSGTTLTKGSGIVPFAVIPKDTTGLEITVDGRHGAEDDIQIFTEGGKHLIGTGIDDFTWEVHGINTPADMESNVLTSENGFHSGVNYDNTSLFNATSYEYDSPPAETYNGMTLRYSGDADRLSPPDGNNDGDISSPYTTEKLSIDTVTEDLILIVSGTGIFDITASWTSTPPNSGLKPPFIEFQVGIFGSAENRIGVELLNADSHSLGLSELNLQTIGGANEAISRIEETIQTISNARTKFGATQNRLNNSQEYMNQLSQNTASTVSKIEDADMAETTSNLIREKILANSGLSMVAQIQENDETMNQLIMTTMNRER